MANVRDSRSKFHEKIGRGFDVPSEHVESSGEILIKELAQNQTNTKLNLEKELSRPDKFERGSAFRQVTELVSGQITLREFNEKTKEISNLEHLSSCGLTKEEIELYLSSKNGEDFILKKHKNLNKEILYKKLEVILRKIEEKDRENPSSSKSSLSFRSQKELASAVKPQSDETKLYLFALENRTKTTEPIHPDHPLNQLKEIEDQAFGHLTESLIPSLAKRRKIRKQVEKPIIQQSSTSSSIIIKKNSQWDLKEPTETKREVKTYTCKKDEKFYTISNEGKIVPTNKTSEEKTKTSSIKKGHEFVGSTSNLVSLDHIEKYRLTLNEIKALPKFQHYDTGTPNNVLYIKNLSSGVDENDLIAIFENFQKTNERKIVYKIMGGRMKGQAFITFQSIETATEALNKTNGYLLKGNPIIVQYGRGKDHS